MVETVTTIAVGSFAPTRPAGSLLVYDLLSDQSSLLSEADKVELEGVLKQSDTSWDLMRSLCKYLFFKMQTMVEEVCGDRIKSVAKIDRLYQEVLNEMSQKRFDEFRKQQEASQDNLFQKIFMRVVMAICIVFAACTFPVSGPILATIMGLCMGLMVAQLAGGVQEDVTGGNFMRDMFKSMCGGNEDVANWLMLGVDIGVMLCTLGAGMGRAALKNLSEKTLSLASGAAAKAAGATGSGLSNVAGQMARFFNELAALGKAAVKRIAKALNDICKCIMEFGARVPGRLVQASQRGLEEGVDGAHTATSAGLRSSRQPGNVNSDASASGMAGRATAEEVERLASAVSVLKQVLDKYMPWLNVQRAQNITMFAANVFGSLSALYTIEKESALMESAAFRNDADILQSLSKMIEDVRDRVADSLEQMQDTASSISRTSLAVASMV